MQDSDSEYWKVIPGFPGHMASSMGRIKSINHTSNRGLPYPVKGKIRKQLINKRGYCRIQLIHKGKNYQAHQLIALTFLENPNNYTSINHINGIKTDNRIENLEWCSHSHNTRHAFDMGLINIPNGVKHWSSCLDEIQVKTIRKCISDGMTAYKLAKYFKVSQAVVHNIKHGLTYKDLL